MEIESAKGLQINKSFSTKSADSGPSLRRMQSVEQG
jgi:hypothetical protein